MSRNRKKDAACKEFLNVTLLPLATCATKPRVRFVRARIDICRETMLESTPSTTTKPFVRCSQCCGASRQYGEGVRTGQSSDNGHQIGVRTKKTLASLRLVQEFNQRNRHPAILENSREVKDGRKQATP